MKGYIVMKKPNGKQYLVREEKVKRLKSMGWKVVKEKKDKPKK